MHQPCTRSPTPDLHTYVLRIWRAHSDGLWRCSLQAATSAERIGFASLEQLIAYLLQVTDQRFMDLPADPETPPP